MTGREDVPVTYREARRLARERLAGAGIAEAETDADLLLEYVSGMDRTRLLLCAKDPMPSRERVHYDACLRQREQRIPLQHITGRQYFGGFYFAVNEDVLIPRQDTEVLLEEASRVLRLRQETEGEHTGEGARILDLCTGSGCIVISLKKRFPQIRAEGGDLSEAALTVARKNAAALQAQVLFAQGDLFAAAKGRYDMILSNPPYIPSDQIKALEPEVRDHDPRMALEGGADGLAFYRRIAAAAPDHLKEEGFLLLEIGDFQGEAVRALLSEQGFEEIRILRDLSGADRVVCARKRGENTA